MLIVSIYENRSGSPPTQGDVEDLANDLGLDGAHVVADRSGDFYDALGRGGLDTTAVFAPGVENVLNGWFDYSDVDGLVGD